MYVEFSREGEGVAVFPAAAPVAALSAIFHENPCVCVFVGGVYRPNPTIFAKTREATVVICRQLVVRIAHPI